VERRARPFGNHDLPGVFPVHVSTPQARPKLQDWGKRAAARFFTGLSEDISSERISLPTVGKRGLPGTTLSGRL
jgi:hypothetical protein